MQSFILCIFTVCCTWNFTNGFTYTPITNYQWNVITAALQEPTTSPTSKKYITHFLYQRFQPFVFSHMNTFSRFHKRKTQHISKEELLTYGKMGLYAACTNYNGNSSFTQYASTYIHGALYNCITKNHPISKIPARIRRRKTTQTSEYNYETLGYVQPNIYLGGRYQQLKSNIIYESSQDNDTYKQIWNRINAHPNLAVRRIFHYKFDFYFNIIRSNKHISFLMCCTEENIRKHVSKNIMFLVYNKTKSNL